MRFFSKEIKTALYELKSSGNSSYLYKVHEENHTNIEGIEHSMKLKGNDDKYHPLMFPTYVSKETATEMLKNAGKPTKDYSELVKIINDAPRLDPEPKKKSIELYELGVVLRIIPYEKDPSMVKLKSSTIASVKRIG